MAAVSIDKFSRFCGSKALAWLLIINVGVFLAAWIAIFIGNRCGLPGNFTMQWLCVAADPSIFIIRPWTLISYMTTQYSFLHLLFNVLWLFWFGRILNTTLSDRHLLVLYLGGGILGGLFFIMASILFYSGGSYLVGASASVLAVMTAAAFRTPDLRLMLFLFGEVKLKWVALVCIILTFAGIGGGNQGGLAAHIGGVLFGVGFSLLLKRGVDITKLRMGKSIPAPLRHRPRSRNTEAVARAAAARPSDNERLDQLLDKIRLSGYGALTSAEKNELNALSRKLNN